MSRPEYVWSSTAACVPAAAWYPTKSATSKSGPNPCIIESVFGEPRISSALASSFSGSRLYMSPCESFTTAVVAPPSKAPATAAFASPIMSSRAAGKSSLPRHTCWRWAIPAIPSMSTEMKTFVMSPPRRIGAFRGRVYGRGRRPRRRKRLLGGRGGTRNDAAGGDGKRHHLGPGAVRFGGGAAGALECEYGDGGPVSQHRLDERHGRRPRKGDRDQGRRRERQDRIGQPVPGEHGHQGEGPEQVPVEEPRRRQEDGPAEHTNRHRGRRVPVSDTGALEDEPEDGSLEGSGQPEVGDLRRLDQTAERGQPGPGGRVCQCGQPRGRRGMADHSPAPPLPGQQHEVEDQADHGVHLDQRPQG